MTLGNSASCSVCLISIPFYSSQNSHVVAWLQYCNVTNDFFFCLKKKNHFPFRINWVPKKQLPGQIVIINRHSHCAYKAWWPTFYWMFVICTTWLLSATKFEFFLPIMLLSFLLLLFSPLSLSYDILWFALWDYE